MKAAADKITQISHKLSEELYKAQSQQQPGGPAPGDNGAADGASDADSEKKDDDDVIDAEFKDVN